MDARKKNDFWKLRRDMSVDGRKISVKKLKEIAEEYFEMTENNPAISKDYKGNPPKEVEIELRRGMSIEAFCCQAGIVCSTFDEWEKDKKYSGIVRGIKQHIKAWNLDGAFTGQLNASMVQRVHQIGDKLSHEVEDKRKTTGDIFPEELEID